MKPGLKQKQQRGAALITALIMLILLTLFALSAANTSNTNLKIVSNMQLRTEALNAAQYSLDSVISTTQFTDDPGNAVLVPCGAANTLCVDGYTVRISQPVPPCLRAQVIKSVDLPLAKEYDDCRVSVAPGALTVGGNTGNSYCANTIWEVTAVATSDIVTDIKVTVTQGMAIRVETDKMDNFCKI